MNFDSNHAKSLGMRHCVRRHVARAERVKDHNFQIFRISKYIFPVTSEKFSCRQHSREVQEPLPRTIKGRRSVAVRGGEDGATAARASLSPLHKSFRRRSPRDAHVRISYLVKCARNIPFISSA